MATVDSIEAVRSELEQEQFMVGWWEDTIMGDLERAGVEDGTAWVIMDSMRQYAKHVETRSLLVSALHDLQKVHPSGNL